MSNVVELVTKETDKMCPYCAGSGSYIPYEKRRTMRELGPPPEMLADIEPIEATPVAIANLKAANDIGEIKNERHSFERD